MSAGSESEEPRQLQLFPEVVETIGCLTVKYNPAFADDVAFVDELWEDELYRLREKEAA